MYLFRAFASFIHKAPDLKSADKSRLSSFFSIITYDVSRQTRFPR